MTCPPEFDPFLWHDNPIHGLRLEVADPDTGDWRSDLVLDIDHILAWPGKDSRQFKLAPARLSFHHAGDLQVAIDCGDTGGQVALHELSIHRITRDPVKDQKVCFDRPYYRWCIELNWPKGGSIRFVASGYTLVLRGEPATADAPRLPSRVRTRGAAAP